MTYNEKDLAAAIEQRKKGPPPTEGLQRLTEDICAGQPIPDGWIVVNDFWDPARCGYPTVVTLNMVRIARYKDCPVGTVMDVCTYAPTPTGWANVNNSWNPNCCGYPAIVNLNVKTIKRLT
jgi:hypothetical protein